MCRPSARIVGELATFNWSELGIAEVSDIVGLLLEPRAVDAPHLRINDAVRSMDSPAQMSGGVGSRGYHLIEWYNSNIGTRSARNLRVREPAGRGVPVQQIAHGLVKESGLARALRDVEAAFALDVVEDSERSQPCARQKTEGGARGGGRVTALTPWFRLLGETIRETQTRVAESKESV
ncbi:hypothetical protein B0H19DRAFT_1243558 [Mycena capillaripes]|nr:hypothetical protein B0H19DRAFT_1243558 [Mycena capillaripes]